MAYVELEPFQISFCFHKKCTCALLGLHQWILVAQNTTKLEIQTDYVNYSNI